MEIRTTDNIIFQELEVTYVIPSTNVLKPYFCSLPLSFWIREWKLWYFVRSFSSCVTAVNRLTTCHFCSSWIKFSNTYQECKGQTQKKPQEKQKKVFSELLTQIALVSIYCKQLKSTYYDSKKQSKMFAAGQIKVLHIIKNILSRPH